MFVSHEIFCSLAMYDFNKKIPREMLNTYCYIHSTFIVPDRKVKPEMNDIQQCSRL